MFRVEAPPKFLLEANYYRLAYQLAAQRANGSAAGIDEARQQLELAAVDRDDQELARSDVRLLSERVEAALGYLSAVAQASSVPLRRRLTAKEKRLQRFLLSTVRPSVELILAGMLLGVEPEEADARVDGLLRRYGGFAVDWVGPLRSSRVTRIPWSYRAYYNLACYATARDAQRKKEWREQRDMLLQQTGRDAGPPPDVEVSVALWGLQQAFRLAHDRQRTEVVRWGAEDPSLERLRTGKRRQEFDALIARYGEPVSEPTPGYEIVELGREPRLAEARSVEERQRDRAIAEVLRDRPGYDAYPEVAVVAGSRRVAVDALLQATAPNRADVVIEVKSTEVPTSSEAMVDQALGVRERYEQVTGRPTKVLLVVVALGPEDSSALEATLKGEIGTMGDVIVLEPDELGALRRIPLPG